MSGVGSFEMTLVLYYSPRLGQTLRVPKPEAVWEVECGVMENHRLRVNKMAVVLNIKHCSAH